jgi:hypothetical protein
MSEVSHQSESIREAIQRLTEFAVEQMEKGANRETVKGRLMERGVQEDIAVEIVARAFGSAEPAATAVETADTPQSTDPAIAADLAEVPAEVAEEEFSLQALAPAIGGGAAGALIGGIVWGLIASATGYEIGWVAWGDGWLAGFGVVLAARGQRGKPLQLVAAAAAVFGIFVGKYLTFFAAFKQYVGEEYGAEAVTQLSVFSVGVMQLFGSSLGLMLSGFDALWVILAVATAWGIPKAKSIELQPAAETA